MTFRAVLCGCGAMARGWLEALRDAPALSGAVVIVGLVDLDRDAAAALAAAFDLEGVTIGSDLDAVLAATRPDLLFDVVIPAARHRVVCSGLAHGCHVLSEKPMAASMAEAEDLLARARAANRRHAVVQNRRFIAGIRRLRAAVDQNIIGALTAVHCDFFIAPHFGGFREAMDHVLLLDMAIHTFDAARFVSGQSPEMAFCLETNPRGSWYAGGAAANALFRLSGDVIFTYRGSWCAEGAPTSWESAWRLVGSRGMLTWDGEAGFSAAVAGTGAGNGLLRDPVPVAVPSEPDSDQTHGHASVIAEFLSALRQDRAPETAGEDNIQSLAMVFAAIDSARTGLPVPVTLPVTPKASPVTNPQKVIGA